MNAVEERLACAECRCELAAARVFLIVGEMPPDHAFAFCSEGCRNRFVVRTAKEEARA